MSEPSGTGTVASANVPQRHFKSPPATANGACGSVSRVDHRHHRQDQEAPPQQPTVGALGAMGNEAPCLESSQEGAGVGSSISISAPAELQSKVSATSSTLLPGCDQEVLNSVKPSMDTQPCAAKDIESDRIDPPPLQDTLGSDQVEVSSKDKTPGTCGGHQKSNTSSDAHLPDESGNPKEAGINMGDPFAGAFLVLSEQLCLTQLL
ncbi:hypothetical protein THAOC_26066 [Thalassiosira oceanica]|uniref:Uncharacterized protein n=1 Tax=Thalassiosira oceanica TaxID=159749 RepID=K0RKR5_THAOC|nr:hypothetical protein THAOC_26066 [Thalassiosira oceanica]|eukprot:EJK54318.1 hypothetical protein THAOC_26066 [Thalassiosira oceanica]